VLFVADSKPADGCCITVVQPFSLVTTCDEYVINDCKCNLPCWSLFIWMWLMT